MNVRLHRLMPIGCLLAAAALAAAQNPTPAPAPLPQNGSSDWMTSWGNDSLERAQEMAARVQEQMDAKVMTSMQDRMGDIQRRVEEAQMLAQSTGAGFGAGMGYGVFNRENADSLYERGQSALDRRRWDEALSLFNQAATRGGNRADGALYWEAYAANKLGRRDAALAALATLRSKYSSSRWLSDANALELEVKQASGQPVSPDSQTDEDLKLLALNGLMQSDPDRAIPTLEALLKSAQSPKLKERALFVLAQSDSPKAQQLIEQVARGGAGNPDLQLKAINYIGVTRRRESRRTAGQPQATAGPLLAEIYSSSNDVTVKRAILNSMAMNGETDRLLEIVKTEKTPGLRADAVRRLSSMRNTTTADALAAIYPGEADKDVKRAIIDSLHSQNNVKAMVACARTEKDPEMVRFIVGRIAGMRSPEAADYLMEILKK